MTTYSRSAYGINPHQGVERNNASERGWGPGWPNCQVRSMVKVEAVGASVLVRREIAELVRILFIASERLGYDINPLGQVNQTWGFACRAIRGTSTASNHSWGLAVDINSLSNPMGSVFKSNIPPRVVDAWEACGFYWGGRYLLRPDAMHLEYIRRPQDVTADLARARAILNPTDVRDTHLDGNAIRAAARGADQQGSHYFDARQFVAFVRAYQAKYYKNDPSLENTEDAWNKTWQAGDNERRGELFSYLIRYLQSKFGLKQDGIFGPQTAGAVERFGYTVTNKAA